MNEVVNCVSLSYDFFGCSVFVCGSFIGNRSCAYLFDKCLHVVIHVALELELCKSHPGFIYYY